MPLNYFQGSIFIYPAFDNLMVVKKKKKRKKKKERNYYTLLDVYENMSRELKEHDLLSDGVFLIPELRSIRDTDTIHANIWNCNRNPSEFDV